MKVYIENLIEEYYILFNKKENDFNAIKEASMFMAMSEKYGKILEDRETVIKSLKERIEELKEKEKIDEALNTLEGIKKMI